MARHLFIVFTNPVDGREEDYNGWYDDVHLDDVVAVPGILSAQRFRLSTDQMIQDPVSLALNTVALRDADMKWRYLALYEIEADDVSVVLKTLTDRAGTGVMVLSDAMAPEVGIACYQPIGVVRRANSQGGEPQR